MLSTKELKTYLCSLFAEKEDTPYVAGNGILTSVRIGFDAEKIEKNKRTIAKMLEEIGIAEKPMISLESLTKLKNGEAWNELQTMEDFQALELLLASSNACGFILNDETIKQLNINEMGELNSILISSFGPSLVGDQDKWLRLIRETIINHMYFLTDIEKIQSAIKGKTEEPESPKLG